MEAWDKQSILIFKALEVVYRGCNVYNLLQPTQSSKINNKNEIKR